MDNITRWKALGPLNVNLTGGGFSLDNIKIFRFDDEEFRIIFNKIDKGYWSPIFLSSAGKSLCWITLDFEVNSGVNPWEKAVNHLYLFLQSLGLFKSTLSLLMVGGLLVRQLDEVNSFPSEFFGLESSIYLGPRYVLWNEEYNDFLEFLNKYKYFRSNYEENKSSEKQLKRIYGAIRFYTRSFQSVSPVPRFINLCISLECLFGEGQHELKYRYSNRVAMLLGDNIERRKSVYNNIRKLYDKRSKILHGRTKWSISPKEVLTLNEIIRQSILRCISLYIKKYKKITQSLDDCLHDPNKHKELLKDSRFYFGKQSDFKIPKELRTIF